MNHLSLIIQREYLNKVKNKSFLIMTILSPIIMIVLIAVVAYLSQLNNSTKRTISILDETGNLHSIFENTDTVTYNKLQNMSLEEAKALVERNDEYGLLYIQDFEEIEGISKGIRFYSEDSPSLTFIASLEDKLSGKLTDLKRIEAGMDIETLNSSRAYVNINQESFSGEKTSKADSAIKLVFGCAAGYLLFMFIIIYGNMIMRSVIEEKTSRIIEIIISSVKPIQLMLGKIIGTSLAGITQFIIWVILGGVLFIVVPPLLGLDMYGGGTQQEIVQQAMDNPQINSEMQNGLEAFKNLPLANLIFAFIFFFIGGYLLYSSLYAAIGAAVDSETDTQQFLLPILMPLILAVYIGIFTVIEDPHGTVSTVFSLVPFTSPVVMLMRIPFGVPWWQQVLSLVLLFGTFMFTVWFAAKIYRVGILMYGKKPSYKELIKWIKY